MDKQYPPAQGVRRRRWALVVAIIVCGAVVVVLEFLSRTASPRMLTFIRTPSAARWPSRAANRAGSAGRIASEALRRTSALTSGSAAAGNQPPSARNPPSRNRSPGAKNRGIPTVVSRWTRCSTARRGLDARNASSVIRASVLLSAVRNIIRFRSARR